MSAFDIDGLRVTVTPSVGGDLNEAAFELACRLSTHDRRVAELEAEVTHLKAERDALKAEIKPPKPSRLLGTGYVRFCGKRMWLLNRRDRGFGEFGYWFESWDELFRHFDVRVVDHGQDEHGPWWSVEPARGES